jgi:hypothetical protein
MLKLILILLTILSFRPVFALFLHISGVEKFDLLEKHLSLRFLTRYIPVFTLVITLMPFAGLGDYIPFPENISKLHQGDIETLAIVVVFFFVLLPLCVLPYCRVKTVGEELGTESRSAASPADTHGAADNASKLAIPEIPKQEKVVPERTSFDGGLKPKQGEIRSGFHDSAVETSLPWQSRAKTQSEKWGRRGPQATAKRGQPDRYGLLQLGIVIAIVAFGAVELYNFLSDTPPAAVTKVANGANEPQPTKRPETEVIRERIQRPSVTARPDYDQAYKFPSSLNWQRLRSFTAPASGVCDVGDDNSICIGLVCISGDLHFTLIGTGGMLLENENFVIHVGADNFLLSMRPSSMTPMSYEAISIAPIPSELEDVLMSGRAIELATPGKWFIAPLNGSASAVPALRKECA